MSLGSVELAVPAMDLSQKRTSFRFWSALGAVAVAQLAVAALMPVFPEEAYHWNYARHLDWSYYDHPPMIAWSIALGRLLLGDTRLGIRLVPLLFSLGTTFLLARLARRFFGENAALWAILLSAVQPAAFLVGGWGFPDAPLLFFWALTLTLVWRALETRRPGWWLAAGATLGAGMLSKYTISFLVPSVLLYLLFSKRDRRHLATPWPYLAGFCSLAVFAPVLYWNWTHDWVSFKFQSTARFAAADRISLREAVQSAGEQWLFLLPLTLPLAVVTLRRIARSTLPAEQFLFWCFAPMAAFFFVLGWTPSFHLLWPLPAYQALTVAMAGTVVREAGRVALYYRAHWRWLAGCGIVSAALVALHGAFVLPGVPPIREMYGWDEAALQCRSLRAGMAADSFYMALGRRSYPSASQLAFHLNAPDEVYGPNLLGMDALQFRYWVDPSQLAGKDAVVAFEGTDSTGSIREALEKFFQEVEPEGNLQVPIGRSLFWPRPTTDFTLYRARHYRPAPVEPSSRSQAAE